MLVSFQLEGKIRSATRFLTERTEGGGVMDPNESAGKPQGKSVMEVLLSKHPDQQIPDEAAFIQCEELPIFLDVEITATYIERVAHKLSGGAGPSGFTSSQLQDLLLKYGNHSAEVREAFSALSRRLANTVVPWEDIRAMKAKRLIALNKLPGVRPIGVGEVADRFLGKIMAYVTGDDVRNECNNDQLCSGIKGGIEGAIHAVS